MALVHWWVKAELDGRTIAVWVQKPTHIGYFLRNGKIHKAPLLGDGSPAFGDAVEVVRSGGQDRWYALLADRFGILDDGSA